MIALGQLAVRACRRRVRRQRGRLVQAAQVVAVAPHVVEDARGGVGIGEGRDVGAVQDLLAGRDVRAAHPARQDRLAVHLGVAASTARRSASGRSWPAASGSPAGRRCSGPSRRSRAPWRSARARRRRGCRPGCCGSSAAGRIAFERRPSSRGESSASSPPPVISASVASTPGPPALVTIVRRGPLGRGCLASTSAM